MPFDPDNYIETKGTNLIDVNVKAGRFPANAKNMALTGFYKNKDIKGLKNYLKNMNMNDIHFKEYGEEIAVHIKNKAKEKGNWSTSDMLNLNEMHGAEENLRTVTDYEQDQKLKIRNSKGLLKEVKGSGYIPNTKDIFYRKEFPWALAHEGGHAAVDEIDPEYYKQPSSIKNQHAPTSETGLEAMKKREIGHYRNMQDNFYEETLLKSLIGEGLKYDPVTADEYMTGKIKETVSESPIFAGLPGIRPTFKEAYDPDARDAYEPAINPEEGKYSNVQTAYGKKLKLGK